MKCPNCGYEIKEGCLCPECGVDAYVFLKAAYASIRLYNKGLELAQRRELSDAAEILRQSLAFDKNNIASRNLLGLIECELGHMAEALRQWIISTSVQEKDNPASRYLDVMQKNHEKMERYDRAVVLYNQALQAFRQGNSSGASKIMKEAMQCSSGLNGKPASLYLSCGVFLCNLLQELQSLGQKQAG